MGDIEIVDSVLAPQRKLKLFYSGKDPFSIVGFIKPMAKEMFNVTGSSIYEDIIKWDATDSGFYGMWKIRGNTYVSDKWTLTWFYIRYQGTQSMDPKKGKIWIELQAEVKTKIPYNNFLQKAFWFFYFNIFYNKQRREYVNRAKDYLIKMKEALQQQLGMSMEEY